MNCEQANELIGPYVDDALPAEARRRIEAHLLHCAACAWEAQTQRITRERLREHAAGEVVASDAFRARTLARLRTDNPHLSAPADEPAADTAQYRLPIGI